MEVTEILGKLVAGESLSADSARALFHHMLSGKCAEVETAAILTALRTRGETAAELIGAASVLREMMLPLETGVSGLLDTCGTGGDHAGTFNISTATALVVAAAGVPVSKHGNRSVSSSSGSADVLTELGINIQASPDSVFNCLREVGIAFFFAPNWHPAMKAVMPVRRALRFRTIFNFLGPLCNPARADYQLVGVCGADWAARMADALAALGTKAATIVAGEDGLDEVTLAGRTHVFRIHGNDMVSETWTPADFGLSKLSLDSITVSGPAESAQVIRDLLAGKPGPARDIVLANAAAALLTVGKAADLPAGVQRAAKAIDSGAAEAKLHTFVTQSCA